MNIKNLFHKPEKFTDYEAESPAVRAERKWDEREGEVVVQNYNLCLLLIGLMSVVIILVGALVYKSLSASVMPYAVEVDTTTGAVINIGTIESSKNYKPSEAVYKYFLSKFVKNIREVPLDPIVYRENLNSSYGFLTKSAMAKLQTMLKTEGMSERFGHQTVQVEISTVLPMEGGYSYQIRWQEESFVIGSGEKKITPYSGIFTVQTIQSNDEEQLEKNPIGSFLQIGELKIYAPYKFYVWQNDELIARAIPHIIKKYAMMPQLAVIIGGGFTYFCAKNLKKETSHGSASFATTKEIDEAGLGIYEDKKFHRKKDSGVVIGVNPYNKKLMLHNGVEHILLVAPTRSGKGVNTIIPTGLVWKNSIFFFDVKGELWQATAGYRQKVLGQKVMKFEPLCGDGSSARWNPLAEINFQTAEELGDVATIVSIMVKPDGEKPGGGDPFWDNAASALLSGVIMHLMYKHYREKLRLPCPTDIMSFLSSLDKDLDELFTDMKNYAHISPEEFLEQNGRKNPLKEIYGEYILNLKPFNDALELEDKDVAHNLEELKQKILESRMKISWSAPKKEKIDEFDDEANKNQEVSPFYMLLVHPKVAECATNMLNGAEQTRASIMQVAQTAMSLYQNPIVQRNTEVSDFCIQDLLSPKETVSLYLCMNSNEVQTLKPLSRLLINTMLQKLIREIKFDSSGGAKMKQRLLLMLDEFPQLGNLKSMELALAVCAGYGIKVCIVAQDINQLNKEYTKDNSIGSNCHIHVYFTPNLDSGGSTAESISKNLGKQTITTMSHSDGGGLGKGSNSESFTGRELMTADEVSHMSAERELVFVAGHKPIYGNKLRYYLQPTFLERLKKYQEIYVREHNFDFCKKISER